MTVRELIIALLDTPLDAEVQADAGDEIRLVTEIQRIEHTGAGYGMAYVTLGTDWRVTPCRGRD